MKFKRYIYLILNIGFIQLLHAQETKTYTSENGDFVYQYYENSELERIYDGTYKKMSNYNTINGQFKKNLKIGNWKYVSFSMDIYGGRGRDVQYEKDFKENKDTVYRSEVSGNYHNNMKNGIWTFKSNYNLKSKEYYNIRSFEFKNDTIIGNIDFTQNVGSHRLGYKGQIDSLGNFTGLWQKRINSEREDIIEFHKGFVIKELERDLVTGDIFKKYIPNRAKIISEIDKIDLKKIEISTQIYSNRESYDIDNRIRKDDKNYLIYMKNVADYYFEKTNNMGWDLVGIYLKAFLEPLESDSPSKDNINTRYYIKNPIYLIKLTRNGKDHKLEKFDDRE